MASEELAKQAAAALNQAASARQGKNAGKVAMANGIVVDPRPFLEARAKMSKKQNDFFNQAERLLKRPKADCHYAFAKHGSPITAFRVAEGAYKYVEPSEVKPELASMFTNHKGVGGDKVCFGSLVLVEISSAGWMNYFVEPEIESVARMAAQQENYQAEIEEASAGRAQGTVESKAEVASLGE